MAEITTRPHTDPSAGTGTRIREILRSIGPALVLAAVVIGPGSLTLSTIAGSSYGYSLLWVPVAATILMIIYTWMSARITLVTGKTLFQITREKYGNRVAAVGGVFGYLSILAFQAGNIVGSGFALNALFGMDPRIWYVLISAVALGIIFLPSLYRKLEVLVEVVVGLMLLTFVGTLVYVGIQPEAVLLGLVPSFPDVNAIFLTLGMTATTFSIGAAVYQGYLMREKNWGREQLSREGMDTVVGITVLGLISAVILLTSAGVIYVAGRAPVFSAQVMAAQLEPLAGPAAFYLFTIGFFFASFSSLLVNPLIGATLLVDGLGRDSSMDNRPVKVWTTVAMVIGLSIVMSFKTTPVEVLRFSQALSVVAFPLLGFLVLTIASDRKLMGEYAGKRWMQIVAGVGYVAILAIVANFIRQIVAAM